MTDESTADALQVQIDAAQDAGDAKKANALYREQMGVEPESHALEPVEPVAEDEGSVEPVAEDTEVESDAPVVATPGFEELTEKWQAEYVPWHDLSETEQNDQYEKIYAAADPEMANRTLQVAWGGDMAANVEFAKAMMVATPGSLDVLRVLESVGMGDHPAILKWLASAPSDRKFPSHCMTCSSLQLGSYSRNRSSLMRSR